jgi:hypothetical protein
MAIAYKLEDDGCTLRPVEELDGGSKNVLRPMFENEDLSTKYKLKEFSELWRAKLTKWDAGKVAMLIVWVNLEWSIWEAMRIQGGANIPPEPKRERKAILQALDSVINWCEPTHSEVSQAALSAVVEGGLAGVLQAASTRKATERCTEVIRTMLAADGNRYTWSLADWMRELSMGKQTIQHSEAWKEIMAYRDSKKRESVSRKTAKKK